MTFEQEVKLQLVALAEYLQTSISDVQIRMYAADLVQLGPEGLARAIALLKDDPDVWAGRMVLPAKLKAYVRGDVSSMAIQSANKILACCSIKEAYDTLSPLEIGVAKDYGLAAIVGRLAEQSPTIFAHLRDSLKAELRQQRERKSLGHDRRDSAIAMLTSAEKEEGPDPHGEGWGV